MKDVLGQKESKLPSSVAGENSLTNPKQVSNFQPRTRHPDGPGHTLAKVHHLGERAFKQQWTNQQVTLQVPQLWHAKCFQNICVQTFNEPASCTHPRLFY